MRKIPNGIHVVSLPELLHERGASATLVSYELLLEQHVATLALATAQLRHERRLGRC